jgi:hypothetical protein
MVLVSYLQKPSGIVEYSSDDPNAQVVLEKDGEGEVIVLEGTKLTKPLQAGHYNVRLATPSAGLVLRPRKEINMDAGGRAFVTVRRETKPESR